MVFWKQLRNKTAGFTLIEVLVAITILGLVVVPIGSSLVVSYRLNARSGDTLQAQLAVSRAVETIMAEGVDKALFGEIDIPSDIDEEETETVTFYDDDRFSDVLVIITEDRDGAAYGLKVVAKNLKTSNDNDLLKRIFVETYARSCTEGGD